MTLTPEELARAERRSTPKRIDYARMQREHPKLKAALTKAVKSGDPDRVVEACRKAVTIGDELGAWPDDWSRWQRELDDALGWNSNVALEDLDRRL